MCSAQALDAFFRDTEQSVFIEVEGKPPKINTWIQQYNSRFDPQINPETDGVIVLQPDANKRAIELRLYFSNADNLPEDVHPTRTRGYRGEYPYRINSNALIEELFELGYRIGEN